MAWERDLSFFFLIKTDFSHKYFYFRGLGPVCFRPFCLKFVSFKRQLGSLPCMNLYNFILDRDKLLLPIKAWNFIWFLRALRVCLAVALKRFC